METKDCPLLTAEDICSIVTTCGNAGVEELTYGGLCVRFGKTAIKEGPPEVPVMSEKALSDATEIQTNTILRQEMVSKDEMLQELLLTDPGAYERAILQGDLEDKNEKD